MSAPPNPGDEAPDGARVSRRALLQGVGFASLLGGIQAWQHRGMPIGTAPQVSLERLTHAIGTAPRVVHFWATWCGVCSAMHDNLDAIAGDDVVTVATRSGSSEDVSAWLQARGHPTTDHVFLDPNGRVARDWGVRAFPSTFFLDGEGAITDSAVGYTTRGGLWYRRRLA